MERMKVRIRIRIRIRTDMDSLAVCQGGNDATDLPMTDFLRRRSDGSVRPSMETLGTGTLDFGEEGRARGHSIEAEAEAAAWLDPWPWAGSQRERVVMFRSGEG